MSEFTQEHFNQVVDSARSNGETLAQNLERCFGSPCRIEATEAVPLPQENDLPEILQKGGLLIGMRSGNGGIIALLPESLPLPPWYHSPDETESAHLESLATEWSKSLFPEDLSTEEVTTYPVDSLHEAIHLATPDENSHWLPLTVTLEADEQPGTIFLVGPVHTPCIQPATASESPEQTTDETAVETEETPATDTTTEEPPVSLPGNFTPEERQERAKRVRQLPVQVTVRLANKRIELTQLQTLSPGSLIMFNKNCEELLDLYVNNTPYCRGEVVKVGENFGLKVDEVGYHIEREARII